MTDVVVVPMEESHIGSIAAIEAQCFSTPWSESDFLTSLNFPQTNTSLAALVDGRVVGYCMFSHCIDEGELLNIATSPDMRNMGIAQKLMDAMFSVLKEKQVTSLFLEVRESNTAAKTLYEKNGFKPITIRKNYYTKPTEHALVMKKHI